MKNILEARCKKRPNSIEEKSSKSELIVSVGVVGDLLFAFRITKKSAIHSYAVSGLWIASAESRSVRGASHQPIFMGDCLTNCHTYLSCLPREWVTCFTGSAEVSVDAMWM